MLWAKAQQDRQVQQYLLRKCADDPVFWVNNFVTTYNPRSNPKLLPFILFDRQEKAIESILDAYESNRWLIIEKSRYCGASWFTIAVLTHKLIFEKDFQGSLASRKAELVDKIGNPDTLFEKAIAIVRRLPAWMRPNVERKIMLLRNPSINSTLVGEGGDNIGRGGRASLVIADEFAFVDRSEKVLAALSENTDCAIFVSTPNGLGNKFYEMRQSGAYEVFRYHWRDDPRRSQGWYERKLAELGEVIVAQELDISYDASVEGIYIPSNWVMAAVDLVDRLPELTEAANHRQIGFDVAGTGKDSSVAVFRRGTVVERIEDWQGLHTPQSAFRVDELCREFKAKTLCFDSDGLGDGVAGTLEGLEPLPYSVIPFHGSGTPSDREWEGLEKTSKERFLNKRIEAWAIIRDRFKKTFETVKGIREHPLDELISIPNHSQLIVDLSKPTAKYSSTGKLKLASKQEMREKGLSSPDYADALAYAFYEGLSSDWLDLI